MKLHNLPILVFLACLFFGCKKDPILPAIHSATTLSAGKEETVTITGKNLLVTGSVPEVSINDITLTLTKSTNDTLIAKIPARLGSGKVVVNIGGTLYDGPEFEYNYKATVTTIAGSGAAGATDGKGTAASFKCPWGIAVTSNCDLYIADTYNRQIRKVAAGTHEVTTIPLPTFIGGKMFASPYNIALDTKTQNLYVTDFNKNLMRIDAQGGMDVIYTGEMSTAGITVGNDGYLYMSNYLTGEILKLSTSGQLIKTLATGLRTPRNVFMDRKNNLFVSSFDVPSQSAGVFKIDASGKTELVFKDKDFKGWEVAVDTLGNFFAADHFNNNIRIYEKNGRSAVIAGNGTPADVDGVGLAASFDGPQGITIDCKGNIYITTYNYDKNTGNKIRKVVVE